MMSNANVSAVSWVHEMLLAYPGSGARAQRSLTFVGSESSIDMAMQSTRTRGEHVAIIHVTFVKARYASGGAISLIQVFTVTLSSHHESVTLLSEEEVSTSTFAPFVRTAVSKLLIRFAVSQSLPEHAS